MRRRQELCAVAILAMSYGIVSFEMFGAGFLMPFIAKNLSLSNTEVGLLFSAFWFSFAVSCSVGGALVDAVGRRREVLTGMLLVFSLASVLPGMAGSFRELLLARIAMGFVEGPILPTVHSIVSKELPRVHRGMNMGVVQTVGGSVLGVIVAPVVLLPVANRFGWQWGFFLVMVPGLVLAILSKTALPQASRDHEGRHISIAGLLRSYGLGFREMFSVRNLWLCALGAAFVVGFISITLGFLPLFLMRVQGLQADRTSLLISLLGASSAVMGFVIPGVSDRVGRKPAVIGSSILATLAAVTVGRYVLPAGALAAALFLGWTLAGASPLLLATIPSESASERFTATAIGAINGIGTLTGGVFGPALAGWVADRWSLSSVLMLTAGCAVAVGGAAFGLNETAPLARKA